jgi:hypothetical protein
MKTIRLQQLGTFKANEAKEIKIGDTLVWNFGETSEVTEIVKETEKSIFIKEKSKSGKIYERRFSKDRAVLIRRK